MTAKSLGSPSLTALSLEKLASVIDKVHSLDGLPEELVTALFETVIAKGKLTPRVLELFRNTQHDQVLGQIRDLRIQQLPPVLPTTRNAWLHEKPDWY